MRHTIKRKDSDGSLAYLQNDQIHNDFHNAVDSSTAGEEHIPIDRKMLLTVTEAAEYSNIGINRINTMLRSPDCTFVLFAGAKKLVKRKIFEEYIYSISEV